VNFGASATPSLSELVRDVTRDITDPNSGRAIYDRWREHLTRTRSDQEPSGSAAGADAPGTVPLGALGAGSDFCPFFDHAGIPSIDVGFAGDYGVYHSAYDDFYWMKHFGDPSFAYHVALARILGTIALRLDEADILPLDYVEYAAEITRASDDLFARATLAGAKPEGSKVVSDASDQFAASATRAAQALRSMAPGTLAPDAEDKMNRALVSVEQALLAPQGLAGRPWYKHTIFAPGSYSGYAAEIMPGVSESLDRGDAALLRQESDSLAAALRRASARLDEVTRLAATPAPSAPTHSRAGVTPVGSTSS
jgi:N-acetylated-alpha-linked acidic dipeptidase